MAFGFSGLSTWFNKKEADPCAYLHSNQPFSADEFMRQTEACRQKVNEDKRRVTRETNEQANLILKDLRSELKHPKSNRPSDN